MMKRWIWAGAKAVGASHDANGAPCEDAVACDLWGVTGDPDVLIAAVADGAGSAPMGRVGATVAVAMFAEAVRSSLVADVRTEEWPEIAAHGMETARRSVELLAARNGRPIEHYAATLIGCVMHPAGGIVAQIGDGAAVVALASSPNVWRVPLWPDHGEYINTTRFLTDTDAVERVRLAEIDEPAAHIALFTDGLERLVLDFKRKAPHTPFFGAVFQELNAVAWQHGESHWTSAQLRRLLTSEKVSQRTDDDRTLLIASLREVADGSG
jgi:hypothetical protein